MTPETAATIELTSRIGTIAVLPLTVWLAKSWVDGLKASIDSLRVGMDMLTNTLVLTNAKQLVHAERLDQHDKKLDDIYDGGACLNDHCPLRQQIH